MIGHAFSWVPRTLYLMPIVVLTTTVTLAKKFAEGRDCLLIQMPVPWSSECSRSGIGERSRKPGSFATYVGSLSAALQLRRLLARLICHQMDYTVRRSPTISLCYVRGFCAAAVADASAMAYSCSLHRPLHPVTMSLQLTAWLR